jgi:hypothetical protein
MRLLSIALLSLTLFCINAPLASAQSAGMKREQFLTELRKLIESAEKSEDHNVVAAAGILNVLKGAVLMDRTIEMGAVVVPFSRQELERLTRMQEEMKR